MTTESDQVVEPRRRPPRGAIAAGDRVRRHGRMFTVAGVSGPDVLLDPGTGASPLRVPLVLLVTAPDFAVFDSAGRQAEVPSALPDWALMEGIPDEAVREARLWERHIIEVDTGFLPGAAEGSKPRRDYDPATTTLIERYQAKAAELNAVLDLDVSWQTVQAKRLKYVKSRTALVLVDRRRTRAKRLYGHTDPRVVDQILLLVERQQQRQDPPTNGQKLFCDLRRSIRARHGAAVTVPADPTLYKLLDRMGIDARRPYTSTRHRPGVKRSRGRSLPFGVTSATAPGELVQIDSTDLDVWVLGDDGQLARAELTCAVDVCTRSIIAAVVHLKQVRRTRRSKAKGSGVFFSEPSPGRATKAVDASLLLTQCLVPMAMQPGFDPVAHAGAGDLPFDELVAVDPRFAHAVSRPVVMPDLIVIDHGTVFAGQTFKDACAYLGISVRPARRRTGEDKAIVERTFGAIKSMFSQHVSTYTGNEFMRGARTPDGERVWTLAQLNDLFQEWIATGWQNHPHDELRNPYDANLPPLTPNQMYAACVQSAGYLPLPLGPEDYRRLLPTAWVGVTEQGIRFMNRTYETARDAEYKLDDYRYKPSGLRGKKRGGWELRYNPYEPEQVWLRDHHKGIWVQASFVYQHLVGAPWTQHTWDVATSQHLERGGRREDQEEIARAVAELLERAGRGPEASGRDGLPDGWGRGVPDVPAKPFDPYAGLPAFDASVLESLGAADADDWGLDPPAAGATAGQPGTAAGFGGPLGALDVDDWGMYAPAAEAVAEAPGESAGRSGPAGPAPGHRVPGDGDEFAQWYWKDLPELEALTPPDDEDDE